MASPPEMSLGIPRDNLLVPSTTRALPRPPHTSSSSSIHMFPCMDRAVGRATLLPAPSGSNPVPHQGPSLGPARGTDHPRVEPAPAVAHARCTVALLGSHPASPAQGLQAGSLPWLQADLWGTVTLTCSGWPPNCTLSLSALCPGNRTRAGAPKELFHHLLSSHAARADRRGRSLP